jgi:hypothetical protein
MHAYSNPMQLKVTFLLYFFHFFYQLYLLLSFDNSPIKIPHTFGKVICYLAHCTARSLPHARLFNKPSMSTMANLKHLFSFIILFLLISAILGGKQSMADVNVIRVGVVLDLNSTVGEMAESYISMAVSDFYVVNANYQTRLTLFTRDSKDDVVGATC